jgi:hypothetical protein
VTRIHSVPLPYLALMQSTIQAAQASDADYLAIARNVSNFTERDKCNWQRLKDLFHPDARIEVTWYSGPIDGFIAASQRMAETSTAVTKHVIGPARVQVSGDRALSDTDVAIMVRSKFLSADIDVTTHARFFDQFERRDDGVWRIAMRRAIYDKDRIDPVGPSLLFYLAYPFAGFKKYPWQYQHLAAGLKRAGYGLAPSILVSHSAEERETIRQAEQWLGC